MSDLVKLEDMRLAHVLVERYHYSHRAVKNSSLCVVARLNERIVAACFFYSPATRWSEPVLELCRLVREPGADVSLSRLISFGAREARTLSPLLISFADIKQGHHGGVYQAASWNYHGSRSRSCDGFYIDGTFTPRRSCNERYGTSSFSKLSALLAEQGSICVQHFDEGKHLYWRALNKEGKRRAARLGLKNNPYPKTIEWLMS